LSVPRFEGRGRVEIGRVARQQQGQALDGIPLQAACERDSGDLLSGDRAGQVLDVHTVECLVESLDCDPPVVRAQLQLAAALELVVPGGKSAVEQLAAMRVTVGVEGDASNQTTQLEQTARELVGGPLLGLVFGLPAGLDHAVPRGI
jgi:hypothetical protein